MKKYSYYKKIKSLLIVNFIIIIAVSYAFNNSLKLFAAGIFLSIFTWMFFLYNSKSLRKRKFLKTGDFKILETPDLVDSELRSYLLDKKKYNDLLINIKIDKRNSNIDEIVN